MARHEDSVYIGHMLDMTRRAVQALKDKTRTEYDADDILRLGLTHLVQVIGEAARKVSDDFRGDHPEIPWRKIVGMRHRIVHDYMRVDEDILWQVATNDLPALLPLLETITKQE
ncbi:MAG: DUF86 domain-containing protein [Anaerolineales bacterium]|nr:DUF86 domain-containing protein [Anaerolineales bacterium]